MPTFQGTRQSGGVPRVAKSLPTVRSFRTKTPFPENVALSGAATLTLTATGALLSTTTLSGAASLVLTASGALVSTTALSGAATLVLTASGAVVSTATLSGAASLVLTATGAIEANTSLSGASTLALAATGALTASTALSGSVSLTLTATGALEGTATLSGAASLALIATGDLTLTLVAAPGVSGGGVGYRGTVGKLTDAEWDKARKAFAKARRKRRELEAKTNPKAVKQLPFAIAREAKAYRALADIDTIKAVAFLNDAAAYYAQEEEDEWMMILALAA